MSEVTARAAIKTALDGVNQIGVVHDYDRWSNDWGAFLSQFKWRDLIRTWMITCNAIGLEEQVLDGSVQERFTYLIRGFFGLADADKTEIDAIAKVIEVRDALVAITTLISEQPQVTTFELRTFGGVFCHYAEITFEVVENV